MSKNEVKNIKFPNYSIFIIENGFLKQITEEEIKENDYIINNPLLQTLVIDRDKRKIRPYVEDLLNTMDIETKNTKLLRLSLMVAFISFLIGLFIIYYQMTLSSDFKKMNSFLTNIEKIKTIDNSGDTLIFK